MGNESALDHDESLVHVVLLRYEQACRNNPDEPITPYLPDPPERFPALVALARLAIEEAWRSSPPSRPPTVSCDCRAWVEYYLTHYPELTRRRRSLPSSKPSAPVARAARPAFPTTSPASPASRRSFATTIPPLPFPVTWFSASWAAAGWPSSTRRFRSPWPASGAEAVRAGRRFYPSARHRSGIFATDWSPSLARLG